MEPPNGTPPPSPSPPPQRPSSAAPVPPLREDCWTEDSTFALIHAWGDRYLALDRGNFSQQDWQDVADSVNSRPRFRPPRRPRRGGATDGDPPSSSPSGGSSGKARRTGIQCKNRIDTLKKKFKVEKARVSDPRDGPGGGYLSPWPFFADLDGLIGSNFPPTKPSPSPTPPPAAPAPAPARSRAKRAPAPQPARSAPQAVTVPVRPRSHNRTKRAPARPPAGGSLLRPAFSAAAAAAEEEESESEPERSSSRRTKSRSGKGGAARRERGYAELAVAIERLGQIYERVERKKAREMIELEKQRMQFAKDLEQQRMRWFLETQIHLQKIKKLKQTPIDESYL